MIDFSAITAKLDCPHEAIGPCLLINADCLKVLPLLAAGSVDAVVTDPPYGVEFQYAGHDDDRTKYLASIPLWFKAFPCRNAAVTPGIINIGHWPPARWVLAWMKTNSMGASFLSGPKAVSRNLWEPILWYGDYPPHPPSRDIIHAPLNPSADKNDHPCPKPIALMTPLVEMAASRDGTVCDPFMGSGTTGVASIRTGRRFIGIELDPGYYRIACDRIRRELETYQGGPMFAPKANDPELFTIQNKTL